MMDEKDVVFPCPDKENHQVSLYYCKNYCRYSDYCDQYITMINEDIDE